MQIHSNSASLQLKLNEWWFVSSRSQSFTFSYSHLHLLGAISDNQMQSASHFIASMTANIKIIMMSSNVISKIKYGDSKMLIKFIGLVIPLPFLGGFILTTSYL